MIPFTQYLLPNGRQRAESIDRPKHIEDMAQRLIALGYTFEIEMLMTGAISMTCENHAEETSVAHEIVTNGPEVPLAVDRLVTTAFEAVTGRPTQPSEQEAP